MTVVPIAILQCGIVCGVGLSAPAACAAIRAGVSNFQATLFTDHGGELIVGSGVWLEKRSHGRKKLLQMLKLAVSECLSARTFQIGSLPLLLCVAEMERPGRIAGLDHELFHELQNALDMRFSSTASAVIAHGRVSTALALARARVLIQQHGFPAVLIAAVDSMLVGRSLSVYEDRQRLLTSGNSNGFIPGEAASAALVGPPDNTEPSALLCTGIGLAEETSGIDTDKPLRADGLTRAIKAALAEAQCELGELDYRLTDSNGEQYYFKEAALALTRVLRQRREDHFLLHPADCIGDVGAAIGPVILALGLEANRKSYWYGPRILMHTGSDAGLRSAVVLRYVSHSRT